MNSRILLTMVAFFVFAPSVAAQEMPHSVSAFEFLVGDWEGDAWTVTRSGRINIRQREHVEKRLGGAILVVEGTGRLLDEDGKEGEIVFNAFGVISAADSGGYRLNSWLMDGHSGAFDLTVTDNGYKWSIPTPYGLTRYTMRRTDDGGWLEEGEFSRDRGATWSKSMSMLLHRVK